MILLKHKLLLLLLICVGSVFTQNWGKTSNFPGTERDDAVSFVVGTNAYVGTGYKKGWTTTKDFYVFSMDTETWDTIASLPNGKERQYATAFSSNTHGFVFGGNKGSTYFKDLWMYDVDNNEWLEKTPLPAAGRAGMSSFVINDTAYIVGGELENGTYLDEVWAYVIATDTWISKGKFPFGARWRASATATASNGYLIFGMDGNGDYHKSGYIYTPATDSWSFLVEFPENARIYCALEHINNHLIVVGGQENSTTFFNDCWKLDLGALIWEELKPIPSSERRGGMSFTNESALYYTTGLDANKERLQETWRITNPTSTSNLPQLEKVILVPNPTTGVFHINMENTAFQGKITLNVYDAYGKLILTSQNVIPTSTINLSTFTSGTYIVELRNKTNITRIKCVKN